MADLRPDLSRLDKALCIAAAEKAEECAALGLVRLTHQDSQRLILQAGGIVRRYRTGVRRQYAGRAVHAYIVEESWAEREAVLAARALERCLEGLED